MNPGLTALLAFASFTTDAISENKLRPFTVRDSVEMRQVIAGPIYSPNMRSYAFVTQYGNLATNELKAELRIGALADKTGGSLRVAAELSANINGGNSAVDRHVIARPFWSADSRSIYFFGHDSGENRRLFVVHGDTAAKALTPADVDIVDCTEDAGTVLCFAGPDIKSGITYAADDLDNPDHVLGTGQALGDLLFPNSRRAHRDSPTEFELWLIKGHDANRIIEKPSGKPLRLLGSYYTGVMSLSPDRRQAVVIAHASSIPASWESLRVPDYVSNARFNADPAQELEAGEALARARRDYTRARQYILVDLERGRVAPLFDAPAADFLRSYDGDYWIRWSPDGTRIAASATYLPPDSRHAESTARGACVLAVIDVEPRSSSCVVESEGDDVAVVNELTWDKRNTRLRAAWNGGPLVTFTRRANGWARGTSTRFAWPARNLQIRQDLNHPPALFARESENGRWVKVFEPNPQLAAIDLGKVSLYSWKTHEGAIVTGGLAWPTNYVSGRRYPLVIQTHGFEPGQFFRSGTESETSNAGRPLAGRNLFVLQLAEPHSMADGTWRESTERALRVYLAAVDQLASEGLVDPARVGVTGYSRRGSFVLDAIVGEPERFAAAAIANTATGSLFDYYGFVDGRSPNDRELYSQFIAGAFPYGEGLQKWLERSPAFRTDKIKAPLLISAGDPPELLTVWNVYAPLRDQGKPVELQYFRRGQHNFSRPLEVFAHQEMLVDWFDFWLNGNEDPTSSKSAQYARWREMRAVTRRADGL